MNITTNDLVLAGNAVKACLDGDSISDKELESSIKVLNIVVDALRHFGERYYLAYHELNQRYIQLENYMEARKRDR